MSWLDKLRGRGAPAEPAIDPARGEIPHALPLRLRIGAQVMIDTTLYRIAPGAMTAQLPEGHQGVPCYGHIDLGDGYALHRFYLDDDAYLQVSTVGGDVEAIKAFVFHDTVHPPDKAAFQRFVASDAQLGAASIEYAGHRWERVTASTEGEARIPPIAYDEVLYRHRPPRRDDDLTHYAMLYHRPVAALDRDEYLLVTAEDSGPNEFCITYAVGIDLTIADLDIT